MESWDNNSQRHHHLHHHRHRHRRENPSFSSTLLDTIYRSIDEGKGNEEGELILYRESMRKKQSSISSSTTTTSGSLKQEEEGMDNSLRRACIIEKWMEKKVSHEKVVVRRNSVEDFNLKSTKHQHRDIMLLNSSSSSSESSCGGGFSSSESESFRTGSKSRSSSSCYSIQKPKPIRTSVSAPKSNQPPLFYDSHHQNRYDQSYNIGGSAPNSTTQKPKHENGFVKTKSKALKIYGDLKKVKQPISPGGRLASFLNSLFTTGNTKKTKIEELGSQRKSKSTNGSTTTCSSASSFSRSCLSNTPSSRGKFSSSSTGAKRSVRFCPVSVIVDEDCRPCGHKNLHEEQDSATSALMALASNNVEQVGYYVVDDGHRRVQEVAIDLLKSYQKKNSSLNDVVALKNDNKNDVVEFDMRDVVHGNDDNEAFEDDDDDASCASSDLFELDNLSAIGIERYREELPVYETTHFGTNRAIANGFIL
ncbi:protein BIG GRAIN 1-like B [Cannabis sativa]|uniref:protein BIG GRAIN 1-like B n=1 Tax=Cannabis sativa TaxID=3483 RepID=UPI0029CA4363|nr:protein BIG GRAIN 1-like B [Cannabis sativa]